MLFFFSISFLGIFAVRFLLSFSLFLHSLLLSCFLAPSSSSISPFRQFEFCNKIAHILCVRACLLRVCVFLLFCSFCFYVVVLLYACTYSRSFSHSHVECVCAVMFSLFRCFILWKRCSQIITHTCNANEYWTLIRCIVLAICSQWKKRSASIAIWRSTCDVTHLAKCEFRFIAIEKAKESNLWQEREYTVSV